MGIPVTGILRSLKSFGVRTLLLRVFRTLVPVKDESRRPGGRRQTQK